MSEGMPAGEPANHRRWMPAAIVMVVVTAVAVAGSRLIGLNLLYAIALLPLLAGGTFVLDSWRSRRRGGRTPAGVGTALAEAGVVAVVLFALIQVIPFGRMPSNPPVTREPAWDSPQTRTLAVRACYDCHSNETEKPWYSNIAPISWAMSDHVTSGRSKLNFSEFDGPQQDADQSADVTEDGDMPPDYYTRFGLHSTAELSEAEVAQLVAGLRATPGLSDDQTRGSTPGRASCKCRSCMLAIVFSTTRLRPMMRSRRTTLPRSARSPW
jgi:Haem-binding domain